MMNLMKMKRGSVIAGSAICLVLVCVTVFYFTSIIEKRRTFVVETDLKESEAGYFMLSIGQDYDSGGFEFRCVGASLEKAIETLQKQGVIKSKWIVNRDSLPDGFWDIDLGGNEFETKEKIREGFFAWVGQHFKIELKEEVVRQDVLFCEFPADSKAVKESTVIEPSKRTTTVNGEFGMEFKGTSPNEFCEWLREFTRQPVTYSSNIHIERRYDFFLPCFPPDPESIYEGLNTLGIRLRPGVADIDAVVVVATK